ncbi:ThiJ domain protein, glyoxylase III [Schizosaccharomyces pombe]|uniref:Probable glutathione-independent glyoxalase hsp3104 n=1 Tax=Schizosaccharomyces pombe (strain 972 / ATCC 24843) TaxID=284812 RepID=HSP34_SCHPO|nr:ThiJ domain protein [Schizosaccharomyces pombe]Q10092.1 RecName: Full=Probable glutathione-independent glyoxalase hsp3104; AltName: Full=Glyoxalase 3 homolog 4; AltName: Full=Heat shock protein 31 homolog 4 [Schizosaccharomyces pombe 972h-]CAA92314.1 ThiJ domain protein [Schizosaccharomyces pombe]|eukprot:NP_592808.1 ThiJ domain protein [Schizosaccharomyces pombe]
MVLFMKTVQRPEHISLKSCIPFKSLQRQGIVFRLSVRMVMLADDHSISDSALSDSDKNAFKDKNNDFWKAIKNAKNASDINFSDYSIFFAAGGHGTLFDFPSATNLHKGAAKIYSMGGVIAAVCHGPVILPCIKDSTGFSIVKGKTVTAFNEIAEQQMNLMPTFEKYHFKTLNKLFQEAGSNFVDPQEPFDDFVKTDGKLVTGANPASAASTAKAALNSLNS